MVIKKNRTWQIIVFILLCAFFLDAINIDEFYAERTNHEEYEGQLAGQDEVSTGTLPSIIHAMDGTHINTSPAKILHINQLIDEDSPSLPPPVTGTSESVIILLSIAQQIEHTSYIATIDPITLRKILI